MPRCCWTCPQAGRPCLTRRAGLSPELWLCTRAAASSHWQVINDIHCLPHLPPEAHAHGEYATLVRRLRHPAQDLPPHCGVPFAAQHACAPWRHGGHIYSCSLQPRWSPAGHGSGCARLHFDRMGLAGAVLSPAWIAQHCLSSDQALCLKCWHASVRLLQDPAPAVCERKTNRHR